MLTVFVSEIREQAAAIRAFLNIFGALECDNVFIQRANDSIWRELVAELSRVFDKGATYGEVNCSFLLLRELCLEECNTKLFPNRENDDLIQDLNAVIEQYYRSLVKKSRDKQLAHHDMKRLLEGKGIEISFDELELLIFNTTHVFEDIYTHVLCCPEVRFSPYDLLVKCYEKSITQLFAGEK